jgi:hypothetical protein
MIRGKHLLTRQELFDKAYLGMQSQGFEASTGGEFNSTQYRGNDGRFDPIGFIVPSDVPINAVEADLRIEAITQTIRMIQTGRLKESKHTPLTRWIVENVSPKQFGFLTQLQDCHEFGYNPHNSANTKRTIKERLKQLATYYALSIPKKEITNGTN